MNTEIDLIEEKMSDVANDCPRAYCYACKEDYYDYAGNTINEREVCSDCFEQLLDDFKNDKLSDYDFFDEFDVFPTAEVFQ